MVSPDLDPIVVSLTYLLKDSGPVEVQYVEAYSRCCGTLGHSVDTDGEQRLRVRADA